MKLPGSDHPISIEPNPQRVRVVVAGQVVADTMRAVTLRESRYQPVLYIPRDDAAMTLLERTDHATHCPYKGEAAYFSIRVGERVVAENAVWSYERPYPALSAIAGLLAFYRDRVDAIEELAVVDA
jgi:uncharacterized protein (DUF427 family)